MVLGKTRLWRRAVTEFVGDQSPTIGWITLFLGLTGCVEAPQIPVSQDLPRPHREAVYPFAPESRGQVVNSHHIHGHKDSALQKILKTNPSSVPLQPPSFRQNLLTDLEKTRQESQLRSHALKDKMAARRSQFPT